MLGSWALMSIVWTQLLLHLSAWGPASELNLALIKVCVRCDWRELEEADPVLPQGIWHSTRCHLVTLGQQDVVCWTSVSHLILTNFLCGILLFLLYSSVHSLPEQHTPIKERPLKVSVGGEQPSFKFVSFISTLKWAWLLPINGETKCSLCLHKKKVVILNTFLARVVSSDQKEPKITYLKTNCETV